MTLPKEPVARRAAQDLKNARQRARGHNRNEHLRARKKARDAAFWRWLRGMTSPRNQNRLTHLNELCEAVINEVGGKKAVAAKYKMALDKAPDGSVPQQRLLEGISRMVQLTSKQADAAKTDESLMTDEEIDAKLNELLGKDNDDPTEQPERS